MINYEHYPSDISFDIAKDRSDFLGKSWEKSI